MLGGREVVFVTSDALAARRLRKDVERAGWMVRHVPNPADLVSAVDESAAPVVVVDLDAGMGHVLDAIRESHPMVPRMALCQQREAAGLAARVPSAQQFVTRTAEPAVIVATLERLRALQTQIAHPQLQHVIGKVGNLPSLPTTYHGICQVLATEGSGIRDVALVVERDVAVAARAMQIVNSALYGLPRRVSTIGHAVMMVGMVNMRDLVLAIEVFRMADGVKVSGAPTPTKMQERAVRVAMLCKAVLTPLGRGPDGYTAGLLHSLGRLLVMARLPEVSAQIYQRHRQELVPLPSVERELLGTSLDDLTGHVLELWGLPHSIVEAVVFSRTPAAVQHSQVAVVDALHIARALEGEAVMERDGGIASGPRLDIGHVTMLGLAEQLPTWRALAQTLVRGEEEPPAPPPSRR